MKSVFLRKIIFTITLGVIVSTSVPVVSYAYWAKDNNSYWNWLENDKKVVGWKNINGIWYNFDDNGIMNTGWLKEDGKWYFLSDDGAMSKGWIKDKDGKWYNFSENGLMNIGWINENGKCYYTDSNGVMQIGEVKIDNVLYTFANNGEMLTYGVGTDSNSYENSYNEKDNTSYENEKKDTDVLDEDNSLESRSAYVITESSPLNVRSSGSISSDIIGSLPKGSKVTLLGEKVNGFYKISYNDKYGYVSADWIGFNKIEIPKNDTNIVEKNEDEDIYDDDSLKTIRTTAPSSDNKHYFSDSNIFYKVKLSPPFYSGDNEIKGNCTWYAWGRAWEITGERPIDAGITGNAYEWWEANKKSGKYDYGSTPKVGAIAVWKSSMPGSGGLGHVAIVEKIEDGKIYISESAWRTVLFKYREIYDTEDMYGYIYLDEPNY